MGRLARAGLSFLMIGGRPVPAGRPRVGKFGTYYPKTYLAWQKASWRHVSDLSSLPTMGNFAVLIEAVCEPLKSPGKYNAPMGDVDNFAKGPLDLLTKVGAIWNDDRQITFLGMAKRWATPGEELGFKIWWCEINEET